MLKLILVVVDEYGVDYFLSPWPNIVDRQAFPRGHLYFSHFLKNNYVA